MIDVQGLSGSHAEWPSFLAFNVDAESVSFICSMPTVLYYYVLFIYYLLTYLVSLNLQQNSKEGKSVTSAVYYSISHFGTE